MSNLAEIEKKLSRMTKAQLIKKLAPFQQASDERASAECNAGETGGLFSAAMRASLDAFVVLEAKRDKDGQIVDFVVRHFNDQMASLVRYDLKQAIGSSWMELFPEDYEQGYFDRYINVMKSGEPLVEEIEPLSKRVCVGWIYHKIVPIKNGVAISARDITDRKLAEQRLKENEQRWQLAVEAIDEGLWDWDITGDNLFVSKRWAEIHGYAEAEIEPHIDFWKSLAHPSDRRRISRLMEEHLAGRSSSYVTEHRSRTKSGRWIWALCRGRVVERDEAGRPERMIGTVLDITERKKAEEKLQLGDRVVESSPDFISVVDSDYVYQRINPAYEKAFGKPAGEIVGRHVTSLLDDEFFRLTVKPQLDRALAGERVQYETCAEFPRAGRRFVDVTYAPLLSKSGKSLGVVATIRDITEKKKAERAVIASEAKYRNLIDGSIQGVLVHSGGIIRYANRAIAHMHGYSPEEMMGMSADMLIAPEDMDRIKEYQRQRKVGHFEMQGATRDGSTFWLFVSAREIVWNGKPARQITCIDISDRKRTEDALRRQAIVLEQMHEGVMVTDLDQRIVDANPALERFLGRTRQEILGHEPREYFGGNYSPDAVVDATTRQGQWQDEIGIRHKSGTMRDMEVSVTTLRGEGGQLTARVGVFRDITERKLAENALRESEAKFRNLIEGSIQGVMIHQDNIIVYANKAYAEIHGYDVEEMIGMDVDTRVMPEDLSAVRKYRAMDRVSVQEFRGLRRDGSVVWLAATARGIEWEDKPARQTTVVDVTELKRAEQALRRQAVVMGQINDAVLVTDLNRNITDCNKAAERLFGFSQHELLGHSPDIFVAVPEAYRRRIPGILRAVEETGRWTGEIEIRQKRGRILTCEIALAPLLDDSGRRVATIAIVRDITERKKAEEAARHHAEELSQVLRRNTMGEMTSALAHELNQPLASIANYCRGCLHRLKRGDAGGDDLIAALEKASQQAERAGAVIRQVGDFVRGAEPRKERIDINDVIRGIAPIATAESNQNKVRINLKLAEGLAPVYTQSIEIQHVILNLLRNGIEAVTQLAGGPRRVTVETCQRNKGKVQVEVRDNGLGIPADIRDRVFEPFYTTKPLGMGMGLAISRSIIERNGGTLNVTPNSPEGTIFRFELPVAISVRQNSV
ncbi:MAG: PAS domain S-box protein [Sphingomonadales bacterium]